MNSVENNFFRLLAKCRKFQKILHSTDADAKHPSIVLNDKESLWRPRLRNKRQVPEEYKISKNYSSLAWNYLRAYKADNGLQYSTMANSQFLGKIHKELNQLDHYVCENILDFNREIFHVAKYS